MRNIVFLVMPNFPNGGACPNILSKLAKNFPQNNKYYIISPKESLEELDKEDYYGTTVIRIILWSRLPLKTILEAIRLRKKGSFFGLISYFKSKIEKVFFGKKRSINKTNSIMIEKELRKIGLKIDQLIPLYGIFDLLDASLRYKKRFPSTKLILFQLDPLSMNHIEKKSTYRERLRIEKKAYLLCDRLITTDLIFSEVKEIYPSLFKKTVIIEIPNVDLSSYSNSKEDKNYSNKKYVCTFLGTFYKKIREPFYAVLLFEKLDNVVFNIIGANRESFDFDYDIHNSLFWGKVNREKCNEIIKNSDFLVNIGNNISNQIPSKIFDYISTGKPIINICDSKVCPSISYLSNYGASITLIRGEQSFDDQVFMLKEFLQKFRGFRVEKDNILKNYEKCTIDYCLKVLINTIEELGLNNE